MAEMILVYTLREALEQRPEYVRDVQTLSLDATRPFMGMSPRLGLYGSEEWWRNVEDGSIRRARYSGVIVETYYAGMDSDRRHNSFIMETDDGGSYEYSMLPESGRYRSLYRPGHRAEVVTIFEELKRRLPDGSPELLEAPLEISLSTQPVR